MNIINRANRVIRGTYERRSQMADITAYGTDLTKFIAASGAPINPDTRTPTPRTLLRIFGLATNDALSSAGLPHINGDDWNINNAEMIRIYQALTGLGDTSDNLIGVLSSNAMYAGWEINYDSFSQTIRSLYTGLIPDTTTSCIYPTTDNTTMTLVVNNQRGTVLTVNGFFGYVTLTPHHSHLVTSPTATGGVTFNSSGHYNSQAPAGIASSFTINGMAVDPGVPTMISGVFDLTAPNVWTGAVNVKFDVRDYTSPTVMRPQFIHQRNCCAPNYVASLPPIGEGHDVWSNAYRTAINAFGINEPTSLSFRNRHILNEYAQLILVLSVVLGSAD